MRSDISQIEGVEMRVERPRRGATVHCLQNRRLDLEVAAVIQNRSQQ